MGADNRKNAKTRRPLTAEEKAEGRRLKAIMAEKSVTQEQLAYEMGWKTQGAVSQYIHRIPMSNEVVIRLATKLGVEPVEIRPDVWKRIQAEPPTGEIDEDTKDFAREYAASSDEDRQILRQTLEILRRRR